MVTHPTQCNTLVVEGLARQLLAETQCRFADLLVDFSSSYCRTGLLSLQTGAAELPFMQAAAAESLEQVCKVRENDSQALLRVTSALRTLPQQLLLYEWYNNDADNGVCESSNTAASPGNSQHETGIMIDVAQPNTAWHSAFESNSWNIASNSVHFSFVGSGISNTLENAAVEVFQELYNANNPSSRIQVDGAFGVETRDALLQSPAAGFAKNACQSSGAPPNPGPLTDLRQVRCLKPATGATTVPMGVTEQEVCTGSKSLPAETRVYIVNAKPIQMCDSWWVQVRNENKGQPRAFHVPYDSVLQACADAQPDPQPDDDDNDNNNGGNGGNTNQEAAVPREEPDRPLPSCGNGVRDSLEEECEAYETTPQGQVIRWGDGCQSGTCQCIAGFTKSASGPHCIPSCGNGVFELGEECDPTPQPAIDNVGCDWNTCQCRPGYMPHYPPKHDCLVDENYVTSRTPGCGNGQLDGNEQCDKAGGDGCDDACQCMQNWQETSPPSKHCEGKPPASMTCGNGVVEGSEECDRGQGCSSTDCKCEVGWRKLNPVGLNCEPIPCEDWSLEIFSALSSGTSGSGVHNQCCAASTGTNKYQTCTAEQLAQGATVRAPFQVGATLCSNVPYTVQVLSQPCTGSVVHSMVSVADHLTAQQGDGVTQCDATWIKVQAVSNNAVGYVTTAEVKECGEGSTSSITHSADPLPAWGIALIVIGGILCCLGLCAVLLCFGIGYKARQKKDEPVNEYKDMNVLGASGPEMSPSYGTGTGPGYGGEHGDVKQMQPGYYPNQSAVGGFGTQAAAAPGYQVDAQPPPFQGGSETVLHR